MCVSLSLVIPDDLEYCSYIIHLEIAEISPSLFYFKNFLCVVDPFSVHSFNFRMILLISIKYSKFSLRHTFDTCCTFWTSSLKYNQFKVNFTKLSLTVYFWKYVVMKQLLQYRYSLLPCQVSLWNSYFFCVIQALPLHLIWTLL